MEATYSIEMKNLLMAHFEQCVSNLGQWYEEGMD